MVGKIVNPEQSVSKSVSKVGIELLGQLKTNKHAKTNKQTNLARCEE